MSNIYISEPPTFGKVLLETTVGDIDIELWAKETPKACKNFVQLCLDGYYNGTIFHRIVKGFIAQGGDPTGTGEGGESIYGEPFKDEIHSRLRFNRRGLVAMANAGKDDNGSQFFFTLAACPELQGKHTIFGKVTGETVYNMLKLEEALTDADDRPKYPQKILKVQILSNPFPDIAPRVAAEKREEKKSKKTDRTGVKNFKLLSFGEEAEEDEVESREASVTLSGKGKSTHDVLDDPKLSSVPAVEAMNSVSEKEKEKKIEEEKLAKERLEKVKEKLQKRTKWSPSREVAGRETKRPILDDYYLGKDEEDRKKQRLADIKQEIKELKKNYQKDRKKESDDDEKDDDKDEEAKLSEKEENSVIEDYKCNLEKYRSKQKEMPHKGTSRQQFTLNLLAKFQQRLDTANNKAEEEQEAGVEKKETGEGEVENDEEAVTETWLSHKLNFENSAAPVLAKDANTKSDDWFDITDPRHAINKRRRDASKHNKSK